MNTTALLTNFLRRLTCWVNDNIGDGDGTQHIRAIWADDPRMATHLCDKWNGCRRQCAGEIGADSEESGWTVQQLALQRFLMSLSDENLARFVQYIAENGRTL